MSGNDTTATRQAPTYSRTLLEHHRMSIGRIRFPSLVARYGPQKCDQTASALTGPMPLTASSSELLENG